MALYLKDPPRLTVGKLKLSQRAGNCQWSEVLPSAPCCHINDDHRVSIVPFEEESNLSQSIWVRGRRIRSRFELVEVANG